MKNSITVSNALMEILDNLEQPIISEYQIAALMTDLYIKGGYNNKKIKNRVDIPNLKGFRACINELLAKGVLKDFKIKRTYAIFGKKAQNEEEIICSIDPFAYISHLSAMEYHGLTGIIPKTIYFSSPTPQEWRLLAQQKMLEDYNNNLEHDLPKLTLLTINKFGEKNIFRHSTKHWFKKPSTINGSVLRISNIGQTFLDMVRKPDLCGGIKHVIEAYKEYSSQYLSLIISTINKHAEKKIEKIRAGFILEELCGIRHEIFDEWSKEAQRGGSQKLDPGNEYNNHYSEKWCLSINVETD